MPAMLDDPTAPVIYRTSGQKPFPVPHASLPVGLFPRHVTLRDRITAATLIPFSAPDQVPLSLMAYLCEQLNAEIEKGDTYPMISPMPLESFGPYWFANFGAVMLLGDIANAEAVRNMEKQGVEWEKHCLGTFYIKPNYPGRSSHVCNGGFIVTPVARNKGVGRQMGEAYLEWAPKLGYTYSVFNLVYETNVASCRIWDALGFKRIGRVKGCGALKSYPDQLVDAIIYGRDLGQEEDSVSEERFDKIRYYLKHGKYPNGADRAEKSRLRSAATHYKLLPATAEQPEKLMLKGKEVIADPQRQYEIARMIHFNGHGGINKSTAAIAERYHWVRIKETVSAVIKNCPECNDASKVVARPEAYYRRVNGSQSANNSPYASNTAPPGTAATPQTAPAQTAPVRPLQSSNQTSFPPSPFSPTLFATQKVSHPEPLREAPARTTESILQSLLAFSNGVDSSDGRRSDVPLDPQLVQRQRLGQVPSQDQLQPISLQQQLPTGPEQPASEGTEVKSAPIQTEEKQENRQDLDEAPSVGQPEPELKLADGQGERLSNRMEVEEVRSGRENRESSPSEQLFRESMGFYQASTGPQPSVSGTPTPAQGELPLSRERRPSTPPSVGQAGKKRKRTRKSR